MGKTRKLTSLILALMLIAMNVASVFAEEIQEEPQTVTVEESATEESSKEVKEESEAFSEKVKIDGVEVSVEADKGVFPNGSTLSVNKIEKKSELKDIEKVVSKEREPANVAESFAYDIKVLKDGEEVQPNGEVNVSFKAGLVENENLETNVYHLTDDSAEMLEGEANKDTYTAVTDGFSRYVVEFTYNDLTYVMDGDTEIPLSNVLKSVGLNGEVSAVEGSNDKLFSFEQKKGEWYVKANKAFQTEEWMKVTIDGVVYEIVVTDDMNFTITFQSGDKGSFSGGGTTNSVTYGLTTGTITKYSHTPNISDSGTVNGTYDSYGLSQNTTDVVTIPGATSIHVAITYATESTNYDWAVVWAGNHPEYSAKSNYSSGLVIDGAGPKLGGSTKRTKEIDISGDTVTFGFCSDDYNESYGTYGYYAVITGAGASKTILSGTYKEPISNDEDYIFNGWNTESDGTGISYDSESIDSIEENTILYAQYKKIRGNYTLTFHSTDGQFEGGGTSNSIVYNLTIGNTTKYSHTPNVSDAGVKSSDYANSLSTNNVVSIPGATELTVDIYYNGEDITYDWLSVWVGNHPSYTAGSNAKSTGYVTTAMGAPNNNNKFGGSQSGSYTVNGNSLTSMGHATLTIPGDSVTFGFKSDSSGAGNGYGYYAVVTGFGKNKTVESGAYEEPIPNDSEYDFIGWNTAADGTGTSYDLEAIDSLETDKTLYAQYKKVRSHYTLTYNSGTDGHFEGGGTTNAVTYVSEIKEITKYSHTPNVSDTGAKNGNYANNLNTNDVVSIPGASELTVDVYCNGESVSYDWLSVWAGDYPSYTAKSNAKSEGYVTTAMGAPNNNNKFGGSGSTTCFVNGVMIENVVHYTFTIPGNTVTFGFTSDSGGCGVGYGYYATIKGAGFVRTIDSGTYKEPISNDPNYIFEKWEPNPDSIVTNATVTAAYEKDLLTPESEGTYDGVDWKIKKDGTLVIGRENTTQSYTYKENRSWPWLQYADQITGAEFIGPVNGNGTHQFMFNQCKNMTYCDLSYFNTSNVTNMDCMFNGCSGLTSLDVSHFDTGNVTNMDSMFQSCSGLLSLDVSHFDTDNVTNMGGMFSNCSKLTNLNISGLNTSNVTNMSGMFNYCSNLTTLDVSSFNTENVTHIYKMFRNCSHLTSLDVSRFDTSKATDMDEMFYNCSALTTLDVSHFETGNVTNMYNMFYNCSGLTSLNVANFDTDNVTNMGYMFYGCSGLTSLDVSHFDTSKVTSMSDMFCGCTNLPSLNVTSWDTSKVTSMYYMFKGCSSLTVLDVSHFNTGEVTRMDNMFQGCSNLTTLDVSHFDTSNVTNITCIFSGCSGLTSLDVSEWDIAKITVMESAFSECSGLTSLDVSGWGYINSTSLLNLFNGCSNLSSLDLSSFDTSKVEAVTSMFSDCSALTTIYVSDGWTIEGVSDSSYSSNNMFLNCSQLVGEQGTVYSSSYTNKTRAKVDGGTDSPGYLTYKAHDFEQVAYAVFDSSDGSLVFFKDDAAKWYNKQVDGTKTYYYNVENINATGTNEIPWYSKGSSVTSVRFDDEIRPNSTAYWFYNFYNSSLTTMDLSNLKTDNVTDMSYMFYNCLSLTNLNVSDLNVSNVTDMFYMFDGCSGLKSLNMSEWDTSNVTNMGYMFYNCSGLTSLDITGFDTDNVTRMQYMFGGCSSLTSLDVSNFDTGNVTNMFYIFYNCSGLTSLDVSEWDTSKTTDMEGVFFGCNGLTSLDVSNWNTSNVTSMESMFRECRGLTSIDVSDWDTSKVTEFNHMFYNCSGLTSIDLSEWDTSKATTLWCMFNGCSGLTSLDLSKWDTGNVTDMSWLIANCNSLTSFDIPHLNTSQLTDMNAMFYKCSGLTSIDLSDVDTSNVTNMGGLFSYCSGLTSVDVSYFDTGNVTNMNGMFSDCTNLPSLDATSWDTSNLKSMYNMFQNCSNLETIFVSDTWDVGSVTNSSNMFNACTSLVGGAETAFDSSAPLDKTRAIIDGGISNPGYLTYKAPGYAVTYDANEGTNAPAKQRKEAGADLTLTTDVPTRDGYDFIGWNTEADGSGDSYASGATYSADANVTLYAQWAINLPIPTGINHYHAWALLGGMLIILLWLAYRRERLDV